LTVDPSTRSVGKLPRTRAEWSVIILLTAILGNLWLNWTRLDSSEINLTSKSPSPDIGHLAPDFTLDALNGDNLTLSEFRGHPVILNFWATWCGPCRAEAPALETAADLVGDSGVILGVNVQEDPLSVMQFIDQYGLSYPIVLDSNGEVAKLYRVRAYPTTYFINANGTIAELYTGALNAPLIQKRIRELTEK
jgi:cytochrome c biogenesis protein CcmG, thiol:disulfide interchange protein DsbE